MKELTKDNLESWKALLSMKMKDRYGIDNYSDTKSDQEWIEEYTGATEEDAISDEIQYWEE